MAREDDEGGQKSPREGIHGKARGGWPGRSEPVGAESRRRYGCSLVCNLYRMSVPSGIGVRLKPSGICYESYDSLLWKCDLILIEKKSIGHITTYI